MFFITMISLSEISDAAQGRKYLQDIVVFNLPASGPLHSLYQGAISLI